LTDRHLNHSVLSIGPSAVRVNRPSQADTADGRKVAAQPNQRDGGGRRPAEERPYWARSQASPVGMIEAVSTIRIIARSGARVR
jgi:hypothetical protein